MGCGIIDATYFKWRYKYGVMDISDAKKLKALEEENQRQRRFLVDSMLVACANETHSGSVPVRDRSCRIEP
jgi:hypothetical protein